MFANFGIEKHGKICIRERKIDFITTKEHMVKELGDVCNNKWIIF